MAEDLTPVGVILEAARGAMSKRQAAIRAGISEGRWRQVVTGRQTVGGVEVPVNPRRETIIAMALGVGADVNDALIAAGFEAEEDEPTDIGRAASSEGDAEVIDLSVLSPRAKKHILDQFAMLKELSEMEGRNTATGRSLRSVARKKPDQRDRP